VSERPFPCRHAILPASTLLAQGGSKVVDRLLSVHEGIAFAIVDASDKLQRCPSVRVVQRRLEADAWRVASLFDARAPVSPLTEDDVQLRQSLLDVQAKIRATRNVCEKRGWLSGQVKSGQLTVRTNSRCKASSRYVAGH